MNTTAASRGPLTRAQPQRTAGMVVWSKRILLGLLILVVLVTGLVQAAYPRSIDAMLGEYGGLTANDVRLGAARSLGAMPFVMLTADSSLAADPAWGAAQAAQRQLSANSRLVVVPSSHFVSLDQSQAVADAIRQVVTLARTGRPLAP